MQKNCMLCSSNPAKYSCRMCGSLICHTCYDKASGTCVACRQGKTIKPLHIKKELLNLPPK